MGWHSTSFRTTRSILGGIGRIPGIFRFVFRLVQEIGGVKVVLLKIFQLIAKQGFTGAILKTRYILFHAGLNAGRNEKQMIYHYWIDRYENNSADKIESLSSAVDGFRVKPLISIIMPTYNAKLSWLKAAIESVRIQIYTNWELCIADDASTDKACIALLKKYKALDDRIKVVFRSSNEHISKASNSALKISKGEWIALMDHDDLLSKDALFKVVERVNKHSDARLIYSDEDKIDRNGKRYDPYFKCDWNYHLFLSQTRCQD